MFFPQFSVFKTSTILGWCRWMIVKSRAAKAFVASNKKRLRLILLPGYCPELNPDELLNQDVKTWAGVRRDWLAMLLPPV
ncbi:MAG: transposase [Pseudohongiellaceae bacterium]